MSDILKIGTEKEFLYHQALNRGYVQIPRVINHCIGISMGAKQAYQTILSYAYYDSSEPFPSLARLSISCNCSVNSMTTYVNELVDNGFILKKKRGRGLSNVYTIVELDKVPLLQVSEMFWRIFGEFKELEWDIIAKAKDKLIKRIGKEGIALRDLPTSKEVSTELLRLMKLLISGEEISMGVLSKHILNQKKMPAPTPTEEPQKVDSKPKLRTKDSKQVVRGESLGISKTFDDGDKGGTPPPSTRKAIDIPIHKWKSTTFRVYYYDLYYEKTGHFHPSSIQKHTGMLNNLLKNMQDDKALLKRYIDTLFTIGYEDPVLDRLTSHRIGEIQTFLATGKKPFYIERPTTSNNTKLPASEPALLEETGDWASFIKKLKGRG